MVYGHANLAITLRYTTVQVPTLAAWFDAQYPRSQALCGRCKPYGVADMTSILEWIKNSIQHTSILFFLLFGALLVSLGLVAELPNPFSADPLRIEGDLERLSTMIVGLLSLGLAILLMYRPPAGWQTKTKRAEVRPERKQEPTKPKHINGLPRDFDASILARRSSLSRTQKKLLALIENEKKLAFNAIKAELNMENDAELYYRLEQLRLLGFIEKEKIEASAAATIVVYRLTASYSERWNTLPADEPHAVKIPQV